MAKSLEEELKPAWIDEDDVEEEPGQKMRLPAVGKKMGVRRVDGDESTAAGVFSDKLTPKEHRRRLYEKYRLKTTIGGCPEWANIKRKREGEPEDPDEAIAADAFRHLAQYAGNFIGRAKRLGAKHLDFSLTKDPTVGYQQGAIVDLKFHPSRPVLVVASLSGTISLFQLLDHDEQIDLKKADFFLQSVKFPKFCINTIDFFDGGLSILAGSGNQNHAYTYDLLEGRVTQKKQPISLVSLRTRKIQLSADGVYIAYLANVGEIAVFDFKTMDHIHTFRAGDSVVDFCFLPSDNNVIYALAVNGAVYIWNLRRRAKQTQFFDEGCVRSTCIGCSQNGQFIACGSNTGIVNLYDLERLPYDQQDFTPKPIHCYDQLTTSVSFVQFSNDAQMMAMGSDVKRMAYRLAHCSTGSVFEDFPSRQEYFSDFKARCCGFSPSSGFFGVGTNQGKVRLYRLKHFPKY